MCTRNECARAGYAHRACAPCKSKSKASLDPRVGQRRKGADARGSLFIAMSNSAVAQKPGTPGNHQPGAQRLMQVLVALGLGIVVGRLTTDCSSDSRPALPLGASFLQVGSTLKGRRLEDELYNPLSAQALLKLLGLTPSMVDQIAAELKVLKPAAREALDALPPLRKYDRASHDGQPQPVYLPPLPACRSVGIHLTVTVSIDA